MMLSVCMATYNGAAYLRPQLDSILTQLSDNDELVISDDSSSDRTVSLVEAVGDKRIRLLEGNSFRSPIFNFENALKHARGDYIFLSDQDDIWLPDKVRVMSDLLRDCDLVVSDCSIIDDTGRIVLPSFFAQRRSGSGFWKNIYKNSYLGCCMAFRSQVLQWALPFPSNIPMHDMWLGLIAQMYGTTRFCPEKLSHYRRHSENVTPDINQSRFTHFQKVNFRFILLHRLFQRHIQLKAGQK